MKKNRLKEKKCAKTWIKFQASTGSERVASGLLGMGPIPVKTADMFTASSPFANPAAEK
jgi:hypothetical protein